KLGVVLRRVLSCSGEDLGGEKIEDDPIFVRGPGGAVGPQEGGASTLLTAEPHLPAEQAVDEPLEADRYFDQVTVEVARDPVDHPAGHDRLAHCSRGAPARAVLEQVGDCRGEIVV